MADFALIKNKIYSKGYYNVAKRLGVQFSIYRSADGNNPIKIGNFLFNQLISIDQDWTYKKAKKYGDPSWRFFPGNGLILQNFDYMVGPDNTYFISDVNSNERLNPILCVECNTIITVTRPTQPTGTGAVGYGGYLPATATTLLTSCPASVLEGTKGETNTLKLPLDTRSPYYKILLPYLGGIQLRISDLVSLPNGNRLVISSVELTGLGWRLQAGSVAA
jgi:hypothetical protein